VKCVEALLAFLVENKASAGDGANFKSTTWQGAASHVNAIRKEGAAKTKESCRAKFKALKATYLIVKAIRNNSGWHWDDELGACIDDETAGRWDDYVAAHPEAGPFRNKGWPHLEAFDTLCGDIQATGAHVFHSSQSLSTVSSSAPVVTELEEVGDRVDDEMNEVQITKIRDHRDLRALLQRLLRKLHYHCKSVHQPHLAVRPL
jgi:hypothetical protein